jgi:pyruvate ferredoxin oxidoreductase delta subunit
MSQHLKDWKEIPIGGLIIDAGNSQAYQTGGWRAFRPVVDMEACTSCLLCWIYCPDVSIEVEEGEFKGIDYGHCKGCGICAEVCPVNCISMLEESEFLEEVS